MTQRDIITAYKYLPSNNICVSKGSELFTTGSSGRFCLSTFLRKTGLQLGCLYKPLSPWVPETALAPGVSMPGVVTAPHVHKHKIMALLLFRVPRLYSPNLQMFPSLNKLVLCHLLILST